jgi:PAS domain S-box-containing protein
MNSFRKLLAPLDAGVQEKIIFDTFHRRKDGSTYPAEIHLQLIEYMGEKVYMALVIDITERRTMRNWRKKRPP